MTYNRLFALSICTLATTLLACSQASTPPASPTELPPPAAGAAPDGSTLKVTAPRPVSPAGGVTVEDDAPELVIENAGALFGDGVPLAYVFEVLDLGSNIVYQSGPVGAGEGRTSHAIGIALESDRSYIWRAYAVNDGQRGPMSASTEFRVFSPYGTSCAHLGNELAIVECRRAQFGYMSESDRVAFLRRIAHDLGRASREHAPYGILVKSEGHNCQGYSCDIICSNTGGVHRQWDVLSDEDGDQVPGWGRLHRIAARPCEVVQ
jgi:hypothetical protein